MSLEGFQQAWLELLLGPSSRLPRQAAPLRELSAAEREDLALAPEQLAPLIQAAASARREALAAVLPARIAALIGRDRLEAFLARLGDVPLPPPYPRRVLLARLLARLLEDCGREGLQIPHLRDLAAYELAAAELVFFALPVPLPPTPGPVLAPWARLLRLGDTFPQLLERLGTDLGLPGEGARQRFLLTREFRGLQLELPPPLVARCLERCKGQSAWPEIVTEVLAEQPDPGGERAVLDAWLAHYLQRGVLMMSNPGMA